MVEFREIVVGYSTTLLFYNKSGYEQITIDIRECPLICIRKGKDAKDRTTIFSDKLMTILRAYYRLYKPRNYLFEGQTGVMYTKQLPDGDYAQSM